MTPAAARLRALVLAALAVVGAVAVLVPQHLASLSAVGAASLAAVAGAGVLGLAVVLDGRGRPATDLDRAEPAEAVGLEPAGIAEARRDLEAATAGLELPPRVRERLLAGADVRFRRHGLDLASARTRDDVRALVDDDTWTMLHTGALPRAHRRDLIGAVSHALGDLDRLSPAGRVAPDGRTTTP